MSRTTDLSDIDRLYDTFASKLNNHPDVRVWYYMFDYDMLTVEIEFHAEDKAIAMVFNPYNLTEVQAVLENIDTYLIRRSFRS